MQIRKMRILTVAVTVTEALVLRSLLVPVPSTIFGWGKGGNVTSAGWQVTLCDPIWHVSSRSGDGRLACKLLYSSLLYFLLEDRGCITESIRILVPIDRMKQICFQIATKRIYRSQQLQSRRPIRKQNIISRERPFVVRKVRTWLLDGTVSYNSLV